MEQNLVYSSTWTSTLLLKHLHEGERREKRKLAVSVLGYKRCLGLLFPQRGFVWCKECQLHSLVSREEESTSRTNTQQISPSSVERVPVWWCVW